MFRRALSPAARARVLAAGVAVGPAGCGEPDVRELSRAPETAPPPADAPAEDDPRPALVAFGDSLTAGYGIDLDEAWPARLQERLDAGGFAYRVVNAGVSGETTSGGLRRLPFVLDRNPSAELVVIALGGNDGLRGVPVDVMTDNLEAMIREAEGRGLRVLLAGVPAPPELGRDYEDGFAETFRDVAAATGVPLLPSLLDGVAGVAELNQRDGIHPTAEGALRLADNAFAALKPLLAEPPAATAVP
ncbi:MAG: arylesterase [Acidobacteria bacterium]|nr:arylesterase [Acidobacteriota bacterium]